jgi:hypothetical protein
MTTLPLWLATGLYVWQALNFAHVDKLALAMVFAGYAVANIGMIWAAR